MFTVPRPKLLTGLRHNLRDGRVVDMADSRKQMVFDLKVQPAEKPRGYAAASSEVDRRFNLMYCPRVFNPSAIVSRQWKLRLFYGRIPNWVIPR